jgi:P63C domain
MIKAEKPIGRAKGGLATAERMTPEQLSQRAKKGGLARWSADPIKRATHGSTDKPLKLGDIAIPCYVLEDETRVLSQAGLLGALGMVKGSTRSGDDQLTVLANGLLEKGLINNDLAAVVKSPIRFKPPHGGRPAYGYPAIVLADLCEAVLAARAAGELPTRQAFLGAQCELLMRGFFRIGIIALVDEATGYQRDRAKDALSKILEKFIATELQPWVRTFPAEYYQELFRLRGLAFPGGSVRRPQYFGVLTNDIVYKRLAPGVLEELRRVTPRNEDGRPMAKYFQSLTTNLGYPKLREHIGKVIAMMQLSNDYADFKLKLERLLPQHTDQIRLALEGPDEEDDGQGI